MESKDKPTAKNEDDPEKKKRRRKKRVPSRIPMPLEANLEAGNILSTETKETDIEKEKTKKGKKKAKLNKKATAENAANEKSVKSKKPESEKKESKGQPEDDLESVATEAEVATEGTVPEKSTKKAIETDKKTTTEEKAPTEDDEMLSDEQSSEASEVVEAEDHADKEEVQEGFAEQEAASRAPEARRMPKVLTEPEGELFVSERWRRRRATQESGSTKQAQSIEGVPGNLPITPNALADDIRYQQEIHDVTAPLQGGEQIPGSARLDSVEQKDTARNEGDTRRGQSSHRRRPNGALAGAVAGATVEHLRHKKREKAAEKKIEKQEEQIEQLEGRVQSTEQKLQRATESRRRTERVKTELEKKLEKLKNTQATSVAEVQKATIETKPPSENTKQVKQELDSKRAERSVLSSYSPEFQAERADQRTVKAKQAEVAYAKDIKKPDEALEVPKDHRIEQSAWHSIEIDKNTGKLAENQTLTYGEEFHNEQHQEQLRRQIDEVSEDSQTVRKRYAAHGGLQSQHVSSGTPPETIPTLPIPSATRSGANKATVANKPASVPRPIQRPRVQADIAITDVILWAGLGVVVLAILFALGVF